MSLELHEDVSDLIQGLRSPDIPHKTVDVGVGVVASQEPPSGVGVEGRQAGKGLAVVVLVNRHGDGYVAVLRWECRSKVRWSCLVYSFIGAGQLSSKLLSMLASLLALFVLVVPRGLRIAPSNIFVLGP